MRVAGRIHGDTRGAIEEAIAVHVFDDRARAAGHDQRIAARIRRRDEPLVALDEGRSLRAGQWRLDVRSLHIECPASYRVYFRFQRVPPAESSSTMPRADS